MFGTVLHCFIGLDPRDASPAVSVSSAAARARPFPCFFPGMGIEATAPGQSISWQVPGKNEAVDERSPTTHVPVARLKLRMCAVLDNSSFFGGHN